jgi:hypothetical protein
MLAIVLPSNSWHWCCRDNFGRGVTLMLSHADDGTAEAPWPRRDVGAESYW